MDETTLKQAMRLIGSRGGFKAAKNMTAAERRARAKKAAAASARVRRARLRANEQHREGK